jgi:hypothetical protein
LIINASFTQENAALTTQPPVHLPYYTHRGPLKIRQKHIVAEKRCKERGIISSLILIFSCYSLIPISMKEYNLIP